MRIPIPVLRCFLVFTMAALLPAAASAQSPTLDIRLDKPGAVIQPTMYGIFFEDINFAADGGLYAELVKNRSFEFPSNPLQGWKVFGKLQVRDDGPFGRCPHYVRLLSTGHPEKRTGLDNEGFFGIGVREGEEYRFTVWARVPEAENATQVPEGHAADFRIALVNMASMGESQILCEKSVSREEILLSWPLDKRTSEL